MNNDNYSRDVAGILAILRRHWEATRKKRRQESRLQTLSKWSMACGGLLFVGALFIRSVFASEYQFGFVAALLLGTVALAACLTLEVIDVKRPFAAHVDRILERLPGEGALLEELNTFSAESLERARTRLRLESSKVTSQIQLIGGNVAKASLVGLGALAYALLDQYRVIGASGFALSDVTYLGFALLLGLSIGGWTAKFAASQADYYVELISMVIDNKIDTR